MSACSQCGGSGKQSSNYVCSKCGGSGVEPSGGGGGCFTGNTRVKTPSGWKQISQIKKGDIVISMGNNGELIERKVLADKVHLNCLTLRIQTDQRTFGVTGVHSIQTADTSWSRVSNLRVGEVLTYFNENNNIVEHTIKHIEQGSVETVHNLIVEGDYTFIVDGCIAHSFTYFRLPRILYYETVRFIKESFSVKKPALVAD